MALRSLYDRIILKPAVEETETDSGIIVPLLVPGKVAVVVSVGKGRLLESGEYHPPEVSVGDRVIVNQFSELQNEDGVFWVCTEKEILGVFEA